MSRAPVELGELLCAVILLTGDGFGVCEAAYQAAAGAAATSQMPVHVLRLANPGWHLSWADAATHPLARELAAESELNEFLRASEVFDPVGIAWSLSTITEDPVDILARTNFQRSRQIVVVALPEGKLARRCYAASVARRVATLSSARTVVVARHHRHHALCTARPPTPAHTTGDRA